MTNRLNKSEMNAAIIKLKYCEPIKNPEIGTVQFARVANQDEIIKSLGKTYSNNYNIKKLKKFIGGSDIRLIGIGGSSLGAQSIYKFLGDRVKKKFSTDSVRERFSRILRAVAKQCNCNVSLLIIIKFS